MSKAQPKLVSSETPFAVDMFTGGPQKYTEPLVFHSQDAVWALCEFTDRIAYELLNQPMSKPVADIEALQRKACGAYLLADLLRQHYANVEGDRLSPEGGAS